MYSNPFLIQQIKVCNKLLIICKFNGLEPTFNTLCALNQDTPYFPFDCISRLAACCRQIVNNGPPSQFADVHELEYEDEYGPELANAEALDKRIEP